MKSFRLTIFFLLSFLSIQIFSLVFPLAKGQDQIGDMQFYTIKAGDDFSAVGRKYDVGFIEMAESNPGLNPYKMNVGTVIVMPTQYLLPNVPRKGIVVNLAELRIYYFPPDGNEVYTFPIGIGSVGWNTPVGDYKVSQKIKDPYWIAPESIRKFRAKHGDPIPKIVPAGPNNPLGQFAMRLSDPTYLIHGTNEPAGVGRRSSAGCIRMLPEDVKQLFAMVKKGTKVQIINEPYKVGWDDNQLVFEAHAPLSEQLEQYKNNNDMVKQMVSDTGLAKKYGVTVDWQMAFAAAQQHVGVPRSISGPKIDNDSDHSDNLAADVEQSVG